MQRLALYGGSFDPPHLGHVLTATHVLCTSEVTRLHIIPTFKHPYDKDLSPFALRCELVEAATAHLGERVVVDPIESQLGGVSYTIDTVRAIQEANPDAELLWIGGADTWRDRHQWREWAQLETLITPLIVGREGVPTPDGVNITVTMPAISSTDVRTALRQGAMVDHLVPPAVLSLIKAHGLYR
jgi:nicotinate-nucleotide adenylyltransferase